MLMLRQSTEAAVVATTAGFTRFLQPNHPSQNPLIFDVKHLFNRQNSVQKPLKNGFFALHDFASGDMLNLVDDVLGHLRRRPENHTIGTAHEVACRVFARR